MTKLLVSALAVAAVVTSTSVASAGTLYTNNYSDKQLAVLSIGSDGLLTPLAGSPFSVPDYPGAIAISPDGRLLVTAYDFNSLVGIHALAADGTPTPLGVALPANVAGPVAISPDGNYVYAPAGPGGTYVFRIGADGSLAPLGGVFGSADGEVPAVTPDGRFVLLGAYDAGAIERLAVQADGSLVSLGTTPVGVKGADVIRITPDGRFAVVLSDPEGVGSIRTFTIGADGSLTATGSSIATTGALSGFAVLSPNGRFFYNPNGNEDSISTYSIGAAGELAQVGAPVPSVVEDPEALGMSADGRFLYAVRSSGVLAQAFSVGADGTLSAIGGPAPTGGESDGSTPIPRPATPTARFTAKAAAPGKKTVFDATSSFDLGAKLTVYAWDFGDGKADPITNATTTQVFSPTTTHAYKKAGVYDVKLAVGDDASCIGFVYTGQTAYCNARAGQMTLKVDTLPAISKLKVKTKSFAAASISKRKKKRSGTTFTYTLSEKAGVVFTIQRKRTGRKVKGKCVPSKGVVKKGKCTLLKPLGSFKGSGKAGKNATRFSGKVKGRELKPGPYVATAVATDAAKGKSGPKSVGFKIVKPTFVIPTR